MPGLNQKQALFVLEIAKGRSGVEAYRAAGYRGEGHVAEAGASEILKKPEVKKAIGGLQKAAVAKALVTLDTLVCDLMRLRNIAIEDRQVSQGVQAVAALCKLLGFYVDKQQVDGQLVLYKPSPVPTKQTEMSVEEWQALWEPRDADGDVLGPVIAHKPGANGKRCACRWKWQYRPR
jgi:hypothetical protein